MSSRVRDVNSTVSEAAGSVWSDGAQKLCETVQHILAYRDKYKISEHIVTENTLSWMCRMKSSVPYSRCAPGHLSPWWYLRPHWGQQWVSQWPRWWQGMGCVIWSLDGFWAQHLGKDEISIMVLDLQLICSDLLHFLNFVSSETKIPLWRWQWMMIFMMANTISCIVTSVLLNIIDYRQVRNLLDWMYIIPYF